MDIEIVRRLTLARHLYELGSSSLRSANDMQLFSAVNLFQDSAEAFLIAVADHVEASIDQNTKFDKYFIQINAKIEPKELPFKSKLTRLNRLRIESKHHGIQPERGECERLALTLREFFEEVSRTILGASFSTVSAIDLLADGETKNVLVDARHALESGQYKDCAVSCRKALYLEIERYYDVFAYKDGTPKNMLDGLTSAPLFARNKLYIKDRVLDPTDYIVYDHSSVNEKLLTQGVDNTAYWNVWRLTPPLYKTKDGDWVIKYVFSKLDKNVLKEKIDYIFSATLDVVLSIHRTRQATKTADSRTFYLELKQEEVPIYKKADQTSKIESHTPKGMKKIDTDYSVEGLNGDGPYWHISHFEKKKYLWGFIHNDYVK